jgi:hypothetical protein
LELQQKAEAEEREADRMDLKLLEKLRIKSRGSVNPSLDDGKKNMDIEAPGTGPENAIAPEGTRDV